VSYFRYLLTGVSSVNIYITDGNSRAALAITRSLGKKGHRIIVGEKEPVSLAGSSKYCHAIRVYPDPVMDSDEFINVLLKQIEALEIDVVIPVSDITTFLILDNSDQFSRFCKLPFSDYKTVALAADKDYVVNIAQQLGVPVPKTLVIASRQNIANSSIDLPYPIVIKPARSRIWKNNEWHFTSVSYANDEQELLSKLKNTDSSEFPVLLQERIYGPGIGVFTCYDKSKLVAKFSHRRLREKPPSGGVSVLRESIPVDPAAGEYAEKLLNALNWHGVAMIEFKLDQRDNTPKIMEINGRFWGSLQLAIDAGVDFPAILIKTLENEPIEPVVNYKLGVKTRWLCGDLDVLLMLLFKTRQSLNLPPDYPGRLISFLRFITFWGKDLHYEVLSIHDIRPFITEMRHWFLRK
jgi:predicted ATP-grasp superfamily ATP-dependent carboligase